MPWRGGQEQQEDAQVCIDVAAPDFELTDFKGAAFKLSAFRGSVNVPLVFNRGFTWLLCRARMAQLRQDYSTSTRRPMPRSRFVSSGLSEGATG
jgi:peroxiredoxin